MIVSIKFGVDCTVPMPSIEIDKPVVCENEALTNFYGVLLQKDIKIFGACQNFFLDIYPDFGEAELAYRNYEEKDRLGFGIEIDGNIYINQYRQLIRLKATDIKPIKDPKVNSRLICKSFIIDKAYYSNRDIRY